MYVYSSKMSAKMYAVPMQAKIYYYMIRQGLSDQPNSVLASSVVTISPLFITVTLAIYKVVAGNVELKFQ